MDQSKGHQETGEELLGMIAKGDRSALSRFYDLYARILYATALRILRDPREAEDLLQEVFLTVWTKADRFDAQLGSARTWILTLLRRRANDRLRKRYRQEQLNQLLSFEMVHSAGSTLQADAGEKKQERAQGVRTALAQLPADQRQAIELAYYYQQTQEEIAEILQIPLGTVKARIRRGLIKLRDSLGSTS